MWIWSFQNHSSSIHKTGGIPRVFRGPALPLRKSLELRRGEFRAIVLRGHHPVLNPLLLTPILPNRRFTTNAAGPLEAFTSVLPNHLRWRASSMNSRMLSLPRMSAIIFTRSIAWVIVMVLTSARYFVSECHTAKPVCTPVSMPMYTIPVYRLKSHPISFHSSAVSNSPRRSRSVRSASRCCCSALRRLRSIAASL